MTTAFVGHNLGEANDWQEREKLEKRQLQWPSFQKWNLKNRKLHDKVNCIKTLNMAFRAYPDHSLCVPAKGSLHQTKLTAALTLQPTSPYGIYDS